MNGRVVSHAHWPLARATTSLGRRNGLRRPVARDGHRLALRSERRVRDAERP